MAQITYTDKVALNINGDIPNENKVNASDMNEIKTVVNTNATTMDNMIVDTYTTGTDKTYSCDYINDRNTYSTSEANTGKTWIDGKPIYRVCKSVGNLPNNGRLEIDFEGIIPQNVYVTKLYGIAERITQSTPNVLDYVDLQFLTTLLMYRSSNYKLYLDTNQDQTAYTGIVVIEYTKN